MNTAASAFSSRIELRRTDPDDLESIAILWHEGWRDAHLGHSPVELLPHRRIEDFRARVPERLPGTIVAVDQARVIGFVTVVDDEVEQMYVAASARGTGIAALLLREGENAIARQFDLAWLAVATSNARARRFYARNGWYDAGEFLYGAQIAGGTIPVPCNRYEKRLSRHSAGERGAQR